jgi:hypothetical protein
MKGCADVERARVVEPDGLHKLHEVSSYMGSPPSDVPLRTLLCIFEDLGIATRLYC